MRSLIWILLSAFLVSCGSDNRRSTESLLGLYSEAIVIHDPGLTGPYKVQSYLPSGSNSGYKSVIIYYPADSLEAKLPSTTLTGGFTNTKEDMSWLGQHLASHGFIVSVFTPTNPNALNGQVWANGHKASVDTLLAESLKSASPIAGLVDAGRIGVMGYSYGGLGTILAANQLGTRVRSAVPLCAFNPAAPTTSIPYMFITGTNDAVSLPGPILNRFNGFNSSMPKAFVKFNKLSHNDITNGGRFHESIARFATAWSLVFLASIPEYDTYLTGDKAKKQITDTSIFAKPTDYIYRE